jgi:cold shock protein
MESGIVKWFDTVKGYGFIKPDNGDADIFVHNSAVAKSGLSTLKEGQKIRFNTEINRDRKAVSLLELAN